MKITLLSLALLLSSCATPAPPSPAVESAKAQIYQALAETIASEVK